MKFCLLDCSLTSRGDAVAQSPDPRTEPSGLSSETRSSVTNVRLQFDSSSSPRKNRMLLRCASESLNLNASQLEFRDRKMERIERISLSSHPRTADSGSKYSLQAIRSFRNGCRQQSFPERTELKAFSFFVDVTATFPRSRLSYILLVESYY